MKCPLQYGCSCELEELITEDGKKIYRCPNCGNEFCEHILSAALKNVNDFACGNCDSNVLECDCFDCGPGVFCSSCNRFINTSCSAVAEIILNNSTEPRERASAKNEGT